MQTSLSSRSSSAAGDGIGATSVIYLFGSFRLIPSQQTLLDGDARVLIGGRALELLTALVERGGELVTKKELLARAWPRTVVEEGNLKVHIAALRKALGEETQDQRFVATVIGRGYRFVAPVESEVISGAVSQFDVRTGAAHNIPGVMVRPIGRAETINDVVRRLSRARLVTLAGAGGIGKTTVALAVAREMVSAGKLDVWFVGLSALSDASFVPHAVANAIGLAVHSEDISSALANYFRLRNRPQLVILDNCEHVIGAAAYIAEHITAATSQVRVLATSRERLHAIGEHVVRLDPLDTPEETSCLSTGQAIRYSAIELFVERAKAARANFTLADEDVAVVAGICRRLDGIALAIELAATRVDAFGVRELFQLLDDRFSALRQGRRTAPARQKTLLAMLDWSHQLLPDIERVILRRLGIFSGVFSLGSAAAIVVDENLTYGSLIDAIANLVAKSMLSTTTAGDSMRYRLLDTTRDYARRKLADAGELAPIARRHLQHFHERYLHAEDAWNRSPGARWLEDHILSLDDVRAALKWAFSEQGDVSLGVALTVSTIPAWIRLSSLEECRTRVEFALRQTEGSSPALDSQRMKLYTALAASSLYTRGMVSQFDAAWTEALAIAERLGDTEYQLRSLFAGCCGLVYAGRHRAADELLQKFRLIAVSTHNELAVSEADRLTAFAWHHMGRQPEAERLIAGVLDRYTAPRQRSQFSDNHVNKRDGTRSLLSSILWMRGCPDRALEEARHARRDAEHDGHALTIGYVLVFAFIPIALFTGDLRSAEEALRTLRDSVAKHGLALFDAMARGLHGALLIETENRSGLPILRDALTQLDREHSGMRYTMFAGIYARGLLRFGYIGEAQTTIERALDRSRMYDELWYLPELIRIHGDILDAADDRESAATDVSLRVRARL